APQRAGDRGEQCVAASWINHNPSDAFRFLQASARPRFATVSGLVDSVANGHAVPRPRFSCSDPNVFRILGVERDGANRLHRLFIKYRAIPRSAVIGFPNAPASRTHKKGDLPRWLTYSRDTGDASAHCG